MMDATAQKQFEVFSEQFKLLSKLGEGSFGSVWKSWHKKSGKMSAVKMERAKNMLHIEFHFYEMIKRTQTIGPKPIPEILGFGSIGEIQWLGMEILGPTIDEIFENVKKFSTRSILMVGIKLIECLEYLHKCEIIHCDVKGDNFAVSSTDFEKIKVFDFGLARQKSSKRNGFGGSLAYASIAAHELGPVHQKDDIESLGYLLADYHKPLPWKDVQWPESSKKQVEFGLKMKRKKNIFAMSPLFFELTLYMMHVDGHAEPNTTYLKKMFR